MIYLGVSVTRLKINYIHSYLDQRKIRTEAKTKGIIFDEEIVHTDHIVYKKRGMF